MVFGTQIPLVLLKTHSEGPEGDSDLPPHLSHQGLRQTAGANPIQSTQICWETQNCQQVLRLGHLGCPHPHKSTINALV